MKSLLRNLVPVSLLQSYKRVGRRREHARNRTRSAEEVFTEIYQHHLWGGTEGQAHSGNGSVVAQVVAPYVSMITEQSRAQDFAGRRFVDLGCGDFRVGRQLLGLCSSYVGVDVVGALVESHQRQFADERTRFLRLDIARDDLPAGDVCFIRQVLQHLSNNQICAVLSKLGGYRWVYITEHYPAEGPDVVPNMDKVHGGDVRAYERSGVYLSQPPFDLPARALKLVLEVPGTDLGRGTDAGTIRTFLYEPDMA